MRGRHLDFTGKQISVCGSEAGFFIYHIVTHVAANEQLEAFKGGSHIVWHHLLGRGGIAPALDARLTAKFMKKRKTHQ